MSCLSALHPVSIAMAVAGSLAFSPALLAQTAPSTANRMVSGTTLITSTDLEPAAMNALKAMSRQITAANNFSFTARIMREEPGTNGQMLDFFRTIRVQVQRPDKIRFEVQSDTTNMTLWCDGHTITLMPVSAKIYTTLAAGGNLDATLALLRNQVHTHTPLIPFLLSDPFARLADGLESANQVGIVNDGNAQFLQLAFTEPDANWQLWLSGPNEILPRRMAIVYKNIPGQPRVMVDFSDWNLNAEIPADAFVFSKPAGAVSASWQAVQPRSAPNRSSNPTGGAPQGGN